jgi:hypothetical protein
MVDLQLHIKLVPITSKVLSSFPGCVEVSPLLALMS